MGDLVLKPLLPGHQRQFQMVFLILLQFLHGEAVHRLIFLILFGDDLEKLLLGPSPY
jgi:hypothetical protein